MTETTTPTTTETTTPDAPTHRSATDRVSARVAALAKSLPDDPVPDADSASSANGARPPPTAAEGVESASGAPEDAASAAPGSPPEAPTTEEEARRALYAEKLAAIRQRNRERQELGVSARARAEAEQLRAQAEADRKAAAEERARLAEGRKDFRKFFEANGMNAREAYEEMTRQAVEAGTPEGQIKAAQAAWQAEMEALRGEVKSLRQEREEARQRAQAEAVAQAFRADYDDAIKAAEGKYDDLLDAYDDALLDKAEFLRDNPDAFHAHASALKVRLTAPGGRYNMQDILNVLAAVHAQHEETRAKRRAARTAASPPSQAAPQAAPTSTVNGTAERRNAGTSTIGNDLATQRASDGRFIPKGRTAAERLRERTRRLAGG